MGKRIVIAAGGTGGHLFPGLALAKILKSRMYDIQFAIRPLDIAVKILEGEGFPFRVVHASGFPRTLSPIKATMATMNVVRGLSDALQFVKRWSPRVVVGMGGHISLPVAMAGKIRGVPILLHEQNGLPGLTNRLLAPWAKTIAVSFPETLERFGPKGVLTGNPVRDQFRNPPTAFAARRSFKLDENRSTILVFGGSLGAHAINETLKQSLFYLKDISQNIQFLHLTGSKDAASVQEGYEYHKIRATVLASTDQMASAYAAADLVVSRSGATTVTELIVMKKTSILVPYPHASENHQLDNARVLEKHGWAQIIEEKELSPQAMAAAILNWTKRPWITTLPAPLEIHIPDPLEAAARLADLVEKISL